MRNMKLMLSFSFSFLSIVIFAQNYSDVLVITNLDNVGSIEIGEYFANARGISDDRIISISMSQEELIDSVLAVEILNEVQNKVLELSNQGVTINYFLTTLGCPHGIIKNANDGLDISLDWALSRGDLDQGTIMTPNFEAGEFNAQDVGFYLVSRIEANSLQGTKGLIDKGTYHLVNTSKSFAIEYVNGSGDEGLNTTMANFIDGWIMANQNELVLNTENGSAPDLLSQELDLSGLFFLPTGALETIYLENIERVDGLAICVNAFGSYPSAESSMDSPLNFLEKNVHAAVGSVDYFYVSNMNRLLDFYKTYYAPNKEYNLAESFYLNVYVSGKSFTLFGDPKSTIEIISSTQSTLDEAFDFNLYPNPTSDYVQLELEEEVRFFEMDVYDILGQLVDSMNRSNIKSLQYNLSHLPTGEYAIRIKTESGVIATKLIKI